MMIEAKVSKLLSPHELVFESETIDESTLISDEILCKTLISAISPGTEVAAYDGAPPLRPIKAYPRLVGYCNVAEIIATGSSASEYKVGQRILTFSSHRSHFIAKNEEVLAIIPDGVSSQVASTAYIYHLGYDAVLNANIRYGSPVVVLGLGVIGLCAVSASKMAGGKVYAITNHDIPRRIALKMGANEVFSRNDIPVLKSLLGSRLADAVITTSNAWSDWEVALDVAGMKGKICIIGFPGRGSEDIPFNPLDSRYLYHKQLQLQAVGHAPENNDSRHFLKFNEKDNLKFILEEMDKKNIDPSLIISGEKPWSELGDVYKTLLTRDGSPLTFILNWDQ
ncbi:MAG: zinc-binding dehydrogenase [Flavobacteriales bacterium]|nr:zinc-binding dehydrogenase [Flavobacteriales bacterium]